MNEERGAALRLLYQIKRAFQVRDGPPPDALEGKTETGLQKSLLEKVRRQRQEQTQALASQIEYKTQGGKDVRSNKIKNQDFHLVHFDISQKLLFEQAKRDDNAQSDLIARMQQEQRERNIKNLKDNQNFMKEWEQEGVLSWEKNNQIRAENAAKVKYFEDREVNIYKAKLEKELNMATLEMRGGLSEFEKNLQKLGIEQNVNMDDAIKRMEEKKGIPLGQIQNFSYAATINKIKETKKQSDFAGKERERRRTKLMVDQQATQAQIDKQRQEDLLIQKLLNQQAEESRQAFIDHRLTKCKQMQGQSRFSKAEEIAVKRELQMQAIDAKRAAEFKAGEAKRKQDIEKQRLEYAKTKKGKKAERRKVNIEIASELIDLIMDVSNETFDIMKSRDDKKLTKEEWRDFMSIFKDGKRVSLRNVVKKHVDQNTGGSDQNEINFREGISATEIMVQFQNESALPEFYQFLCGTGQFDLAAIKPALWKDQIGKSLFGLEADNTILQSNPELGQLLEELFIRHYKKASKKEFEERPKVPTDFVLKLAILGRAFAGKKTVAKQIQETYGGASNVKIFSMDEIICEALEYITPKKHDEAAQAIEQSKKPPPKKAPTKNEEFVHTDIFEGRDSAEYKRLANFIKSQYFPDFEGEFATKVDLTNQVVEDKLLIDLFVQRLKLEFEGKMKKQDIHQGCVRERDILHQLKDAEHQDQGTIEAKKDEKAKKGPPPKGQVKGSDDLLKEELEKIRSMDVNGWILVGFPRTLTQAKLLEKALSGYETKADKPKPVNQIQQDAWGKITTPAQLLPEDFNPLNEVQPSAFDGVLFLQVGDDEVQRRAKNRKIDPQTNMVYHMEDSPPEETKDNKLIERLQPYKDEAGNPNRIATVNQRYNQSVNLIHEFTEQFGLIDPRTLKCRVGCNMKVKKAEWPNWRQKDAVKEAVLEKVRQIIDFKKELFQTERQRILDSIEEQYSHHRESTGSQIITKSEITSQKPETRGDVKAADFTTAERSLQGSMSKTPDIVITVEQIKDAKSSISHGGSTANDIRSSKLLKRVYEINEKEKVSRWEQMVNVYYKEGVQCFNMMRLLRQRVFLSLNKTQNNFISFLERSGPMQKKINDFCESYNKFNEEFPQLRDNQQTQEELQNRVQLLSQSLWEIIKERNQQAVKERAKYMEGGWVFVETSNLISYIARLIENEWLRFTTISAVVTGYVLNEDLDLQTLVKRLVERGTDPYIDGQPYGSSPILMEVVLALTNAITQLFNEQYFINLEHSALEIITREKDNLFMRLNMLQVWSILMLQEISAQANKVFDVLDDWIVISVKKENELSQRAVKELKSLVAERAAYMDSVLLGDLDLSSQIDTIAFQEGPPQYMQEYHPESGLFDKRLQLGTLLIIYDLFKSNSVGADLLDVQTFITLVFLHLQANDLPRQWRQISFDKILRLANNFSAQPLSETKEISKPLFRGQSMKMSEERQFVNWKRIFMAFALNANPYPKTKDLQAYIFKLESLVDPETGLISEQNFVDTPAFFDIVEGALLPRQKSPMSDEGRMPSTEDDEDEDLDEERIRDIKKLLFKTFKVVNAEGMRVSEIQGGLESLFRYTNDKTLFEELFC